MNPAVHLVVALCVFAVSCGSSHETAPKTGGERNLSATVPSFEAVGAAIFAPHCVSCHASYVNYPAVKRDLAAIGASVFAGRMPKGRGPLDKDLKEFLKRWIDSGANEIAGQPGGGEVLPLAPNWASVSENILGPRCIVCHRPGGQAGFLDLSTRHAIFTARNRIFIGDKKLIDFDSPELSYLLEVVEDPIEPMPPVWSNLPQLTAQEIGTLKEWIALGLP